MNEEFNLSTRIVKNKMIEGNFGSSNFWLNEDDVKEFVRLLKENIEKDNQDGDADDYIYRESRKKIYNLIDKLIGEKLK
jgi:hypothetical protein